ncbi:MAG: hypothetical protein Q8922_09340 [Bacteroidota bacterium]|nr:hypothetical protein [Bacteroidota bacterium]MDP4234238.1 hypothetical protein [Bacteroidota bacterium]MDP4243428.1 hypothetical protein [Bacteroidota bacterium]MDP4288127.1 hypothetical protein [Bacteroidota bacterium]
MKRLCVLLLVSLFFSHTAHAQSSGGPIISYQGTITNSDGLLGDGSFHIAVSLWTEESSDHPIWSDEFVTQVTHGVFNIGLGSGKPLPKPSDMNKPLWISVSINGEVSAAFTRLAAVPFALNVADSSITASKLATDYVGSISVNGKKVTGNGTTLNIAAGNGLQAQFDPSSSTILLAADGGTLGKGAKPQSVVGVGSTSTPDSCTTNSDGGHGTNTVSGGCGNTADPPQGYATVGGGQGNSAHAKYSIVAGGSSNTIDTFANNAAIGGGESNMLWNSISFIGAGKRNTVGQHEASDGEDESSAIVAGDSNFVEEGWGFIGGGSRDSIIVGSYYSSILGGNANAIGKGPIGLSAYNSPYSSISGGSQNSVLGQLNAIVGGTQNYISFFSVSSIIGGGESNLLQGEHSGIISGQNNRIGSGNDGSDNGNNFSVIAGGDSNRITGNSSAIGGGDSNSVSKAYSVIAGGARNIIANEYSAIIGGKQNEVDGRYSTILGGRSLKLSDFSVGFNASDSVTDLTNLLSGPFPNIAYFGDINIWVGNVDGTARELRFYEPNNSLTYSGTNYSSFKAGIQSGNISYTLPRVVASEGQFLKADSVSGSNVFLSWDAVTGTGGAVGNFWSLTGNSGTHDTVNYLGTRDSMAFEIHVHNDASTATGGNKRVMRYEEGATSPNIVADSSFNTLGAGLSGASVLSGGEYGLTNSVLTHFSVVAGGEGNKINASQLGWNSIGGGYEIRIDGDANTIAGGFINAIFDTSDIIPQDNFVGGGVGNVIESARASTIGGGESNHIQFEVNQATIAGGTSNTIKTGSDSSTIGGGASNTIANCTNSTIAGGKQNQILGGSRTYCPPNWNSSVIGGGLGNVIDSTQWGTIGGGHANTIGYQSDASAIGGGESNTANDIYTVIAGGQQNTIERGAYWSSIAGGYLNYVYWPSGNAAIGGGQSNSIHSPSGTISGGFNNVIDTAAEGASIAGGEGLIASGFTQFVSGRYNVPQSSGGYYVVDGDSALAMFGSGTDDSHRANSWVLSNNGHSVALHTLEMQFQPPIPIQTSYKSIPGATYSDNTIVAWGHVDSNGTLLDGIGARVVKASAPTKGTYLVVLTLKDWQGHDDTLKDGSITVTLEDLDTTGMSQFIPPTDNSTLKDGVTPSAYGTCDIANATPLDKFNQPNRFLVHIRLGSLAGCAYDNHSFYFKVCGRPTH